MLKGLLWHYPALPERDFFTGTHWARRIYAGGAKPVHFLRLSSSVRSARHLGDTVDRPRVYRLAAVADYVPVKSHH